MKYIFIVGNSRSGTTLLSYSIKKHSKIYAFNELHYYEGLITDHTKTYSRDDAVILISKLIWKEREEQFSKINVNKYLEEAEGVLKDQNESLNGNEIFAKFLAYYTKNEGKEIACEKTPRNIFFSKVLLDNYPDVLVVNMVRDPRAVLASQKNKWKINRFQGYNVPLLNSLRVYFNYHPITLTKIWKSGVQRAISLESNPNFITIRFEDFVREPEKCLRTICEKVQVEFEEEMLDTKIVTSSFKEDRGKKGMDVTKIDKWKNSYLTSAEIQICQNMAKKELRHFGYEKMNVRLNPLVFLFTYILFPFKIGAALILNMSRSRNMLKSVIRRLKSA